MYKWIKGFENRYSITNNGKVFFHNENGTTRERKLVPDKNGYLTVNLKIKGKVYCKKIHREVANAYIGNNLKETVNHINGIKTDNRVDNLEWCTAIENIKHMRATGLKRMHVKYSNNTTGYYGVIAAGTKYVAQVKRNDINIYIGRFDTAKDASYAVCEHIKNEINELQH